MKSSALKFIGSAMLLAASVYAAPASAYNLTSTPATIEVALLPPAGMIAFCQSHGSQCRAGSEGKVAMSDELLAAMISVNARVNASIRPQYDRANTDKWSLNPSAGDCEDYALTKRAQLIRMGVPAGALRIATTTTRRGEPHAILVVKTSQGDYVLDNLSSTVRKLGASGYRIRKIATPNPMVWAAG